ncbi:MAG: zinc ribbon domain-containing protein [Bacteroidota bacterium]
MVCPDCGAKLSDEATQCDLCGTMIAAGDASMALPEEMAEPVPGECDFCGHQNPYNARFCNQCGSALPVQGMGADMGRMSKPRRIQAALRPPQPADVPAAPVPARLPDREEAVAEDSSKRASAAPGVGKQVALLIGISLAVVIGLFVITSFSRDTPVTPPSSPIANTTSGASDQIVAPPAPPLSETLATSVEEAEASIEAASTLQERLQAQRELVRLLVNGGRLDLAADAQEEVASQVGTATDWATAGHLFYDWMDQQQGAGRVYAAKKAIENYTRSLNIEDNPDVRTDMAVAYLSDPDNPMKAVEETNRVLEEHPDHIQANFNRAVMLNQIGRTDQALEQIDKVLDLADAGSPIHTRATAFRDQLASL